MNMGRWRWRLQGGLPQCRLHRRSLRPPLALGRGRPHTHNMGSNRVDVGLPRCGRGGNLRSLLCRSVGILSRARNLRRSKARAASSSASLSVEGNERLISSPANRDPDQIPPSSFLVRRQSDKVTSIRLITRTRMRRSRSCMHTHARREGAARENSVRRRGAESIPLLRLPSTYM